MPFWCAVWQTELQVRQTTVRWYDRLTPPLTNGQQFLRRGEIHRVEEPFRSAREIYPVGCPFPASAIKHYAVGRLTPCALLHPSSR